jgi:ketosteroid isomerase-like protein
MLRPSSDRAARRPALRPGFIAAGLAIGLLFVAAGLATRPSGAAGQGPDTRAAIESMLATERSFARLSAEQGMRAAFLTYIADDGIGFRPGPVLLKEAVRNDPEPPTGFRLLWEPRYGDIAASGDLGYLTGPYTVESPAEDGSVRRRQGCFFSMWRRQKGGDWRNVLDIGVHLAAAPEFAAGFAHAPHPPRYAGKESETKATRALRTADDDFNNAAHDTSFGIALGTVLDDAARIYRDGRAPITTRAEALRVFAGTGPLAAGETMFAAAAKSGDLGYTYGRYQFAGAGGESGHYARAWVRDPAGAWHLAADITSPDAAHP